VLGPIYSLETTLDKSICQACNLFFAGFLQIDEGEKRYQIAWHYKIPYPRVHNLPLGAFAEKPETVYQVCNNFLS
jgi:hypothetical protein